MVMQLMGGLSEIMGQFMNNTYQGTEVGQEKGMLGEGVTRRRRLIMREWLPVPRVPYASLPRRPVSPSFMLSSRVTSSMKPSLVGPEAPTAPPPGFSQGTCPTDCHVSASQLNPSALRSQTCLNPGLSHASLSSP